MRNDAASAITRREAIAWLTAYLCAPTVWAGSTSCRSAPTARSGEQAAQGDAPRRIRGYLSRLEGFGFSGAVLVARDGGVLLESAHGLANRANNKPWDADTIFDVGSVTKQFTAAAVLALEVDGKLAVSDSITTYLPGVPADKASITIHQLLTHTSGLGKGFGGDYESLSRDALVRRVMGSALASAPGERHAYSNAGYGLLAAIVEIASGTGFDRFARERLFRPAGMTSSGYHLSEAELTRLARGYRDGEDARLPERAAATRGQMWNLIGNGGLYSTITDLHRWMLALQDDRVLPASLRRRLFQPHALVAANYAGSERPLHYAYGWYIWKQPSGKSLVWHLGGNGITNTAIRWHVGDETWVVYASNVSEFHDPRYPVPAVERILTGATVAMPPAVVPPTEQRLARYAGTYRAPTGAALTLAMNRSFLEVGGDGQEAFAFAVDGEWLASPEFQTLNARTAEVVEASRMHRFDVVARFFAPQFTMQGLDAGETAFWRKRHERLGDYVRTRVLGTMRPESRRYIGRTIAAIDFSGGTTWREYFWTAQGLIGDMGPLDKPPRSQFFPVSDSCFVAFDPAEARSARFCVESVGDVDLIRIAGSRATLRLEK
jgi:CubicO group peptidase (beta-lactamase class C family)